MTHFCSWPLRRTTTGAPGKLDVVKLPSSPHPSLVILFVFLLMLAVGAVRPRGPHHKQGRR
jgi:hypothetical protein